MKATDIYGVTAAKIIKAIEDGDVDEGKWHAPWHFTGEASIMTPVNALTRQPYKGGNIIALWLTAEEKGFTSGYWATYKQWTELGAQVRKGEKSTPCVKWVVPKEEDNSLPDETKLNKRRMFPYGFNLFAAEQVFRVDPETWEDAGPVEFEKVDPGFLPEQHADEFFTNVGAKVLTGLPQALYNRLLDQIEVPSFEMFKDAVSYYATLGHEHIHWTGAEKRLNRQKGKRFGDDAYAYEELIAEIGAAFLCAKLHLSNEPRPDHAQYVQSWARQLRNDPQTLWKAASEAQKAVDFLLEAAGVTPSAPTVSEKVEVPA